MTQFKLENHNAVTLLNRLRIATHETTSAKRRVIYNGLSDALKGLGLIEAKGKIEGIYEGVDRGGNHWFMVDMGDRPAEPVAHPVKDLTPTFKALHQAIGIATGAVPPMEEYAVLTAARDVILNAKDSILPSRLNLPERQAGIQPAPCSHPPSERTTIGLTDRAHDAPDIYWCKQCGAIQADGAKSWKEPLRKILSVTSPHYHKDEATEEKDK